MTAAPFNSFLPSRQLAEPPRLTPFNAPKEFPDRTLTPPEPWILPHLGTIYLTPEPTPSKVPDTVPLRNPRI